MRSRRYSTGKAVLRLFPRWFKGKNHTTLLLFFKGVLNIQRHSFHDFESLKKVMDFFFLNIKIHCAMNVDTTFMFSIQSFETWTS